MVRRFVNSDLFRKFMSGSMIFYILSGLTSLVNYLFYPAIARFVSVSDYGQVQFLVSMFAQLSIGFVVLNILAIIVSVRLKGSEQSEAIQTLGSVATIAALIIAGGGIVILVTTQSALGISNTPAILLLGAALVANVPFTITIGRMQGNGLFVASGVISLLSVVIKLVGSLLFAAIGFGVAGIIGGITAGLVVAWIIGIIFDRTTPRKPSTITKGLSLHKLIFIKKYAFVTIIAVAVLTLLSTADSIVSRIVLNPYQAGQYAAIATVTKIILAATTPLMWLSLPAAISGNKKQIARYIGITGVLSGIAVVAFTTLPYFFTRTLIGVDPAGFIGLIPVASISMALFALAFLVVTASICEGSLRRTLYSSTAALVLYCVVFFILFSQAITPLEATLYAQAATASLLIISNIFTFLPLKK